VGKTAAPDACNSRSAWSWRIALLSGSPRKSRPFSELTRADTRTVSSVRASRTRAARVAGCFVSASGSKRLSASIFSSAVMPGAWTSVRISSCRSSNVAALLARVPTTLLVA
jgi:hypothetical protein